MKRRRSLASRPLQIATILTAVGAVSLVSASHDAGANNWPPAPGADMTNPDNWPNDPGYGTQVNGKPDRNGSGGDWNYFSWLPTPAKGTPAYTSADQKLGASGMSVDVGWTYSIGIPDVKISILDSGIEWDRSDVVNKAWLSTIELGGAKRPQDAMGAVCGGSGTLAGFDCNADGVFSVADYRDDPRIAPVVTGDPCFQDAARMIKGADRIKGDINRNCLLDAGDLIEMFSDGVDDDANGYTDDISGWDFYKNDNNPYDDTRYGHGSGESEDSSAEGNNGQGDIGTCPMCRFIMLRVGDSFIADANDFAKAVVYATDNGVNVIQEALGTVDQSSFSKLAIDYAYAHNVTVIASMADENSRHHNMPGVSNHTLPVHAITYNGDDDNKSSSFLAFNTCTNYGGQNMLSVSGKSCSSEATGKSAGIAGLLISAAKTRAQPLALTAEEVMQLLKMTADDIDVPESRSSDPDIAGSFYESKTGFDQRFGYGRVNVAKAMQAIKDGLIPPEVDITAPAWFDILYADRISGPVPIVGRVAAGRASKYDYVVEWAPGVEPDDSQFQQLTQVPNVAGSTTSGGPDMPLAQLDLTTIDTAHTADPDSPHHENDKTITVRIRATAYYGNTQVRGEARRTLAVVNRKNGLDTDLLPGFPMNVGASIEAGTKLADIDGDGVREIIAGASNGSLHVLSLKGGAPAELPGFPVRTNILDGINAGVMDPGVPSYLNAPAYRNGKNGGVDPDVAREAILGAPAVGDLDGDGKPEIVFSTFAGSMYVIDAKGQAVGGWPKRLPLVPSCPLDPTKPAPDLPCMDINHGYARGAYASPVLVDLDGDGHPEIVQAAFDGNIYAYHANGSTLDGFPVHLHSPRTGKQNRIMSTPAVGDVDGDGVPDLASGSNEEIGGGGGSGPAFVVSGKGNKAGASPYLKNWPIAIVSLHLFPVVAEGVDSSPALADFDGDGKLDVLLQGNGAPPSIFPADPGVQNGFNDPPNRLPVYTRDDGTTQQGFDPTSVFGDLSTAFKPDTMFPLLSNPAIGDLDQDGVPDVVMSGGSLSLAGNLAGGSSAKPFQHLLAMWSGKSGHMMPGSPVVIEDYTFLHNMAIADLNGDDYPEVILGTGGYFLRAVDACGREVAGWPKFTNGWIISSPSVGDLDGDHKLDVVVATREGNIFAWKTTSSDTGVVQWESFHHDNANTGNYTTKLDQGVIKRASNPIDCSTPPAPPGPDTYDAGGCSTSPAAPSRSNAFWFLAAIGAFAAARRRKRTS